MTAPHMPTAPAPRRGARAGIIVAVGVLALAFAWLLYGGLDKNVVFFLTPNELLAAGADGVDKPVRLGGQVKPGSVTWNPATLDLRFEIVDTNGTGAIRVRSKGAPPQMFRDGMGVVVEGRLGADSVFLSTNLIIKHSNEYRAPRPGERPQEMYRSIMKGTSE